MMKTFILILFLGLTTISRGQSIENIKKRLNLLYNSPKIKFDTTGFSRLPKFAFFCTSEIIIIEKDGTENIVPSETKDAWRYFSVIDLNSDGLNDLIYSGPCAPYDQTGIFINKGKELQLVYDYPGKIISIEKHGTRTIINSLFEALGDLDFSFREITIERGSSLATMDRIIYDKMPKKRFKSLERIKVKGILRRTPMQDDTDRKDPWSETIIKGNHWLILDQATDVIKLDLLGQWLLVLYKKNKDESIIGWIKSE